MNAFMRCVEVVAEAVYEWANRYVDRCPLSYPYYALAIAAARVLEHFDNESGGPVTRSG